MEMDEYELFLATWFCG